MGGRAAGGGTSVVPLQTGRGTPDHRTGRLPQDTQPYGVNDHLSPGISQPQSPVSKRDEPDDLDGKHYYDFYSAQLQNLEVDYFSMKDGADDFRLRLGAPHQSHSKGIARRNMKMRKCTQAGVLAKSGVLTEKDKIDQNHILAMKCANN